MAKACADYGITPILCPLLKIIPLDAVTLPAYDSILLTSPHGLTDWALSQLTPNSRFHVVGSRAREKVMQHAHHVVTEAENIAVLSATLFTTLEKGHRVMYLSGEHINRDLAEEFAARAIHFSRVITYRAEAATTLTQETTRALGALPLPAIFLGSSRTAQIMASLIDNKEKLSALQAVCLSPAIAEVARSLGFGHQFTAPKADVKSLLPAYSQTM